MRTWSVEETLARLDDGHLHSSAARAMSVSTSAE
jgi:hypothetical protein